ncbi:MAG: hypoxanthine phosphoribosyltransferase [Candidatus Mcinerneyibacterium aminivorans]|uniref:Hypoxanthine phosphoribosyltransferase n=1 Tax=Candidatus Mcinerneyibacterium aminivorans TaxID=2703815 RepID=A0A5D0MJA8_9BACT|nr:MAG: hypoxanthine phosphoribosyltransferase [Candidatus Mcinerneyibacterium aminivorans]
MEKDIERILIEESQIQKKVKELADRISKDYRNGNILLIGILKGSVIFMSDLSRNLDLNAEFEFMDVSSYGNNTYSSGNIRINYDVKYDVGNKDILIVEDIIDTGRTLNKIIEVLNSKNPNSLRIATLLDKPDRRKVNIDISYKGFEIPNEFVVGYGLDYAGKYRNLPYIAVLKEKIYQN